MSDEGIRLKASCRFFYVSKYEGPKGPRPPMTGHQEVDDLAQLQADLNDPACVGLVTGADGVPAQFWRKVHGPDE
jgi:hypothetical protein